MQILKYERHLVSDLLKYMVLTLIFVQRSDPLQVSLSMVPPNHTLLPPRNLEAEASGLLDRLLSVFQENSRYVDHTGSFSCILSKLTYPAMPYLLMQP